jgi:hypothetical protein
MSERIIHYANSIRFAVVVRMTDRPLPLIGRRDIVDRRVVFIIKVARPLPLGGGGKMSVLSV